MRMLLLLVVSARSAPCGGLGPLANGKGKARVGMNLLVS